MYYIYYLMQLRLVTNIIYLHILNLIALKYSFIILKIYKNITILVIFQLSYYIILNKYHTNS